MEKLPTTEADWVFLKPWFEALDGHILPYTELHDDADCVRIGHDPTNDYWLEASIEPDIVGDDFHHARNVFGRLRESLVLTSLMAKADYNVWCKWMCELANMSFPSSYVAQEDNVRVQFLFEFFEDLDPRLMEWHGALELLLGDKNYSNQFTQDLPRVQALLARHGLAWETLESIPVLLRSCMERPDRRSPVIHVQELTSAVAWSSVLEDKYTQDGLGVGSLFKIAALDLSLLGRTMDTHVLDTLRKTMQSGVRVEMLGLPTLPKNGYRHGCEDALRIGDVGCFMRAMLGISADSDGAFTEVVRLTVPIEYAASHLWVPLCSALASAKSIRVLHLQNADSVKDAFGSTLAERRHAWMWLAFALFSSASSSSVETLIVDGEVLRETDIHAIQEIVDSHDPLALLYQLSQGDHQVEMHQARTNIHIDEADIRTVRNGRRRYTYQRVFSVFDRSKQQFSGQVLHEDLHTSKTTVFIPGLGFADVDRQEQERAAKRQRVNVLSRISSLAIQSPSSFQSLVYKRPSTDPMEPFHSLLAIIGGRLKALRIEIPTTTDDTTVEQIFAACSQLESFAIRGARLTSMDAFTRAYDDHRLPLSSLDVAAVSVPEDSFHRFLRLLLRQSQAEATLERLAFGERWAHELSAATLATVRHLLDHNKTLTHLRYFVTRDQWQQHVRFDYHGQLIVGLSYAERQRRLVALGALLRFGHAHPHLDVDGLIKQNILAFAAHPQIRRRVEALTTAVGF